MKELLAVARNIYQIFPDIGEPIQPQTLIECVFCVGEIEYEIDENGVPVKNPVLETVRFGATIDQLKKITENFQDWIKDAERCASQSK